LSAASFALAQTSTPGTPPASGAPAAANPNVRHIAGLDSIKRNATGKLTVQRGALEFKTDKADNKVPVSAIEDIYTGTETTQNSTKTGRVVKVAAMAAPYESGRAMTILMRTKVDILTVSFHDPDGGLHGAIFALPVGQAEPLRAQLIQAGAHTSPAEKQLSDRSNP
jgi:hypothetical protein